MIMKKLVKVQKFANELEGFKVATKEMMGMYAVAMQNGEYRIVVLQDAKNKISVSISYNNKKIECDVIPAKNQADAIEIAKELMDKYILEEEEDAQGFVVENGMSLADAMGIKSDYVGVGAEQLVGKKIKYTAFYKDGRKNTTTLVVKRTELKMMALSLQVELVCYNEKTGNTSFMKFSEKLNSDRINKWVFEVCEENTPEEPTKFKVENTAIDTNQSFTAKLVAEKITDGNKVLDYGCGTGRNMRYIKNNSDAENIVIEGCDIADQLVRNAHKHQELKNNGMNVFEDVNTPKEKYDVVLNSHVLNVIASDEIKQAVVKNIYDALVDGGKAMIEVRTKSDVEGAKHKVPFGDGWHMTKTNTYQESLTKEKMQRLAISAGFDIIEHVSNSSRHYMIVEKNTRKVAVA